LLERWLQSADARGVREPRALALATADATGRPSNRIVLLKQASPSIVFAFSANSRKGRNLATNPRAAGTLYWRETLQQVVIEGPVERMSAAESDRLFAERPPSGQVTTVASRQGEELDDPERLRREADELMRGDEPLGRPEDWGDYRLDPDLIEFWRAVSQRPTTAPRNRKARRCSALRPCPPGGWNRSVTIGGGFSAFGEDIPGRQGASHQALPALC
jgi:dihydrophenazinedicarboxylate synthase